MINNSDDNNHVGWPMVGPRRVLITLPHPLNLLIKDSLFPPPTTPLRPPRAGADLIGKRLCPVRLRPASDASHKSRPAGLWPADCKSGISLTSGSVIH